MDKKEEDAVGVDQSLFDFSRMSRRTFMGSTGAASALLGAGASAAEPQTHDVDLLFNMDIGSHVLGLTIVTETGADTKPTWSIDRRVFGPLAKFSLRSRRIYESEATGMVPGQPSYILDVLGFTHASQVPRGLSFWFFQKLTDGFRRWHIRAETDFFSRDGTWNSFQMGAQGRGPNRREANPVPLRSFAEGAALNKGVALKQIISRARINDTMLRIANGMLRGGDDMELSLTKKGVWVLARLGGRPGLVGPGEDMALKNVELRFPEPPQGGEAEGFRGMVISGLYDDKTDSRMVLGRADRAGAAALTLRGGELELRCADAAQAAVIGEWTVSHQAGGLTTGGFTCPKARLICTPHVRDGDMEVRFEGDPQHRQPVPWVDTPIGRLRLTGSGIATVPEPSGQVADKFATRRDSAIRAHGVRRPNGSSELVWFEAGLLLSESALALAGRVDYSRLRFANAAITLWHSDRPEAPRGSFVRLGRAPQGSLLARLDLSRAELEAARASDMVSLKFRFAGLALEFLPAVPPELVNALQSCGPVALARPQDAGAPDASAQPLPQTLEDRPTLIVEWPPQHVMEQALFLPNPPPLPDVLLNDSTSLTACNKPNDVAKVVRLVRNDDGWTVAEVPRQQAQDWVDPDLAVAVESLLDRLPSLDERVAARRAIAEAKMAREKCRGGDAYTRFHRAFLDRFGNRGRQHRPPRDQRIYIGDMALDPNSRIRARRLQKQMATNVIRPFVEGMLKNVQAQAVLLWDDPRFVGHDKGDIAAALRLEEQLQSAVPMYQLLRSYYRRERLKALAASGGEATPLQIEYLLAHPDRGRAWPEVEHKLIKDRFIKDGLGGDTPEGVMRARLSAPSRLAFHVDCADTIARARVEVIPPLAPTRASGAGQSPPQSDPDEDAALLSGRNRRAWTFEALTDWSGMEPRVTPRADNVYRSTRGGLLDSLPPRLKGDDLDGPAAIPLEACFLAEAGKLTGFGRRSGGHLFGDGKARHMILWPQSIARTASEMTMMARVEGGRLIGETPLTEDDMVVAGEQVRVTLPASVRPLPPRALSPFPIFWLRQTQDRQVIELRRSARIRLPLGRGWFSSGVDERLGVIFWPPQLPVSDPLRDRDLLPLAPGAALRHDLRDFVDEDLGPGGAYVSRMGADPIRNLGKRSGWSGFAAPSVFLSPAAIRNCEASGYVPSVPVPLSVPEDERDKPVPVLTVALQTFAPRFDAAAETWHVDLDIDSGELFEPFVRLGLLRYQPHAPLALRASSPVVQWMQPIADRRIRLERDGNSIRIRFEGADRRACRARLRGRLLAETTVAGLPERREICQADAPAGAGILELAPDELDRRGARLVLFLEEIEQFDPAQYASEPVSPEIGPGPADPEAIRALACIRDVQRLFG